MWLFPIVTTLLSFASLADCVSHSIKERSQIPDGWTPVRHAPLDSVIELHVGLKQNQFEKVEQHLYEGETTDCIRMLSDTATFPANVETVLQVSDPSHVRYGHYLSADEVHDLVKPSAITISLVQEWLSGHGISAEDVKWSPASDWLTLYLPVSSAQDLLQTKYLEYWHKESNSFAIRAQEWSLPTHLHGHIDTVQPTTSFFAVFQPKTFVLRAVYDETTGTNDGSQGANLNQYAEDFHDEPNQTLNLDDIPHDITIGQACNDSAVTPICLRTLYGTLNYTVRASDRNSMALVNYHGEFNNRSDIDMFLQSYRPEAAKARAAFNFQAVNIAGATNQQSPATEEQLQRKAGREGNLDAQVLLGIAFPTPLVVYSTGGRAPVFMPDKYTPVNTNEPFLAWLYHILKQKDLPKVVATSYGDIEQTIPYGYAKRVCDAFAQLGIRGTTVIFGAGDTGVGKPGYCQSNDGTNEHTFLTSFPASCPYGTSVGATRNTEPEITAYNDRNGFVTGGGFSKYFSRPSYQQKSDVVEAYLDRLESDEYEGLYNRDGRAWPDVAAQGYRRAMVWNGKKYLVDGTSVSAPTFAAVVALVNDALIAEGRPSMGFLNPWLYSEGYKAFTDVTSGSNKGCNTSGFHAGEGWDPVSGFGTPVKWSSFSLMNDR